VRADVVHSPHYTMPLRVGRPVVVTLHDATFFTDPHLHGAVKGVFFRSATRTALRRAARCLVPSRATRDELVRVLDADAAGIDVAYHGVDTATFHVPSDAEKDGVRARLGLGGQPYIASLGMLEPRKNLPALVRGWVQACRDRSDPPALVLAGGAGWDDELDRAIAEVPENLRVLRPGYLPFESLPGFLGGALLVAYPSLGEGFGLPVLEAMACGAPVLTTDRLALPEVGGDAVAYTGTGSEEIAAALTELLTDGARRGLLGQAGRARALRFTWTAAAQAHLDAYARAVAS
jgi:glycosyltransferase involved in cell wall biosynthesis